MKKILITNDDGIDADGIIRLAGEAVNLGEVWVVAPDSQRSAASHSVHFRTPIEIHPHDFPVPGVHAYSCSGTPADCVRLGCLNIVPEGPDVLLSGINFGYNVAADVQYSATVGAALEGSFQKVLSIAVSESTGSSHDITDAYLSEILKELMDKPYPGARIYNVNFPACPLSECKGIKWDTLATDDVVFSDRYKIVEKFKDGGCSYMVDGILQNTASEGSDYKALLDNYISVGFVNNLIC